VTDTVIISCVQLQRTIDEFRAALDDEGIRIVMPPVIQALTEDELMHLVPRVHGIVAGDDHLTRNVLLRADSLRVISKWGVGTDAIDTEAAAELGIRVTNTPGVFGAEVADVVIGYLIMLARQLHRTDREVREGGWPKYEGVSLGGRTLGVVGLGDIGQAVCGRAVAMGMRVLGTDVDPSQSRAATVLGVEVVDLHQLLAEAEVISLNCPLTPATKHMIDADALATMRPGVWLINTARGGLVDESALVDALERGQVGAAALDVFDVEPLPARSQLRAFENVILGAHNGSNTTEAIRRTSALAIDNLLRGLREVVR
jgi:D-3-phosphoglycerate dehydrogenase / 2-oxoglutarate reductase